MSSVHAAGQADIGHEEVDGRIGLQDAEAGRAVGRFDDVEADILQGIGQQHADGWLVVDDENRVARLRTQRALRGDRRRPFGILAIMARKIEAHRRALIEFGIDPDLAAGLPYEAVDHGEAEPGALAERLGGEERIESTLDHVGGHAGAGVGHAERNVLSWLEFALAGAVLVKPAVGGFDGDAAAFRHGVAGVDAEVEQRVLELRSVDQRRPQTARRDNLHGDLRADGAADQFLHAHRETVQVGRFRIESLPARERQQPVRQGRRALGGALRRVDVAVDFLDAALSDPGLQQLQRSHDAGEQVVEVVGDAAGQLADRLHLLRLPQRFLRLAQPRLFAQALGDVVDELVGAGDPALGVAQRIEAHLVEPADAAGIAELRDLDELRAGERFCPDGADGVAMIRQMVEQLQHVVADLRHDAVEPVKLAGGRSVDRQPAEVGADHLHEGIGAFDDVGEELAFGERGHHARFQCLVETLQFLLGAFARGDVLEQHRHLFAAGGLDTEGGEFQMAAGRHQFSLEADRLAGAQHAAIELDPAVGLARNHFPDLLADDVRNAGMLGVGGVGFDVDVVAERAVRPVEELDDAEAFVDRVEERPVTLFALCQRAFRLAALGLVGQFEHLQARILALKRLQAALKVFNIDRFHKRSRLAFPAGRLAALPDRTLTRSGGAASGTPTRAGRRVPRAISARFAGSRAPRTCSGSAAVRDHRPPCRAVAPRSRPDPADRRCRTRKSTCRLSRGHRHFAPASGPPDRRWRQELRRRRDGQFA